MEGSVAVMCPHSRFHSLCTHLCACNENKCAPGCIRVVPSDIQGGLVIKGTRNYDSKQVFNFSINELLHYYRCVRSGEIHTLIIQDKIFSYSLSYNYIIKTKFSMIFYAHLCIYVRKRKREREKRGLCTCKVFVIYVVLVRWSRVYIPIHVHRRHSEPV